MMGLAGLLGTVCWESLGSGRLWLLTPPEMMALVGLNGDVWLKSRGSACQRPLVFPELLTPGYDPRDRQEHAKAGPWFHLGPVSGPDLDPLPSI